MSEGRDVEACSYTGPPGASEVRKGDGPCPTGKNAERRRRLLVSKLLADAQQAAKERDRVRVAQRSIEIASLLPRVSVSFATEVLILLQELDGEPVLRPPERARKPTLTKAAAAARSKWFVLDADGLIHRQGPETCESAICGHAWMGPVWEGSVGRSDVRWCAACQRQISRIKAASRKKAVVRANDSAAVKEQRERNGRMREALNADLPTLLSERRAESVTATAGSPGLGRRR